MASISKITPCLWFDDQAEAAAAFYTAIFPDSRIVQVVPYGNEGQDIHGRPPGSVMVVSFELCGQPFTALNGGPIFTFNEAISLQVDCQDQAEVDHYWTKLGEGGDPAARQCGWLKDRYGLSWQIVPRRLTELLSGADRARADRVMKAMLAMKKIDLAAIEAA